MPVPQANWKKNEKVKPPVTTSTTLSGLLGTFRRSIQGVPKTFNADVIEAKKIVTQTEAVVGNLKVTGMGRGRAPFSNSAPLVGAPPPPL